MIKEEFVELATNLYNDKYSYDQVEEYTPANSILKIRCNKCDTVFLKERRIFLRGNTCCPVCDKKSIGNIKIKNFLKKENIVFEEEKGLMIVNIKIHCLLISIYQKKIF